MLKPTSAPGRERRRVLVVLAVIAAVAVIVSAVVVLVNRGGGSSAPSAPGTTTATTSAGPTTQPSTTQPSTTQPSTTQPSTTQPSTTEPSTTPSGTPGNRRTAAVALAPFFSAAGLLDQQLTDASAAINAAGPPWTGVGPDVARKVRAARTAPVAAAIPAGLPHDLLQSVVLVLSDLSSRRYAMESFAITPPDPTANLLRELRNGRPAALRYDGDLAAARKLASRTAAIGAVPTGSRLTAEVLILARYVQTANAGCDSRGGAVVTRLPAIKWASSGTGGTVGGIAFTAALDTNGSWQINLFAC